ncbi:PorT family protein [Arsenicibacter rosenii]|uniref:Outer membrane protein beta-barrel domain-containing protein n=1 Tax=Arsenicibacter rosenii TaxID=1750698 RepID=A0A1S2VND7_9BACT|nr:PorT family protein [Arsenicibacter rosenii]OIN60291.1 hypothetical protein BLX24_05525 [Arsenicibacter rosenii]
MQEYPDNEQPNEGFDGLFRKSAEEFEPTFDPAAWQDMRARLEEHDRKVLMNKWLIRSSIMLAVLLLGFVGWYSWEVVNAGGASVRQQPGPPARAHNRSSESGRLVKTSPEDPAITGSAPAPGIKTGGNAAGNGNVPVKTVDAVKENNGLPVQPKTVAAATEHTTDATTGNPVPYTDNNQPTFTVQPSARLANKPGKRVVPAGLAVERTRAAEIGRSRQMTDLPAGTAVGSTGSESPAVSQIKEPGRRAGTIVNPDFDPAGEEPAPLTDLNSAAREEGMPVWANIDRLQSHSFVWPVFVPALGYPVQAPVADKPVVQERQKVRGFSLRAGISPDLTTIGLRNFVRPGVNLGLLAEYRLSNRWSIQAGAMWSKKVYEAYPDQYEWPSNWKWQVPVLGVDGICSMVDVPLNVRYDIILQPRKSGLLPSRWFVNTGVTSFIMLREVYDYQYENPDDPKIKFKQWAGKTGPYGLSHLNFTVGYERALTRRWAWQVEPFIKAPLQGVGRFKINLISTGAFFSIRYKL